MQNKKTYLGLDIGQKRIGVAVGDSIGRIAQPLATLTVDGAEFSALQKAANDHDATDIVIGLPRNQSGDPTSQTHHTLAFANELAKHVQLPQHWQDESVTSVLAEDRLKKRKKPYSKADIDAEAASIILQDFLERAA